MAILPDRTALGGAPATGDLLKVTDISDTTDAATGTDKKMTVANLFTSPTFVTPVLGVATATSINGATITSGTLNGSVTGTNTGDQTSIVGITGTTAQFNTALSDGDFATLAGSEALTNKTISGDTNKLRYSKTIVIEDPTNAEDLSFFFANRAITITEMRAVLIGSATPSVTWTIRHGTDRSAAGAEVVTSGTTTTSTTTGSDVTSFNDATIVADSFVWLETTAKSGTVDELQVTVYYTED